MDSWPGIWPSSCAVEGVIADAFVAAQLLVVGGRGQRQIVDPRRGRRLGLGCLGFGFRVGVAGDGVRQGFPIRLVAVADLDGFQVERVRTPAPPCARPAPRRPGRCWRAATRWRSWSRMRYSRPQERLGQIIGASAWPGCGPAGPSRPPSGPADSARSRYGRGGGIRFPPRRRTAG